MLDGVDAEVSDAGVVQISAAIIEQIPALVARRRQALSERNIEALVDVYLQQDPLAGAMPGIERDNAEAQAGFLASWAVLTAEAVATGAAHASGNRSATASRWKKAGRIFGMRVSGREAYPAFQFLEGRPHPTVGRVLRALPETMTGWQAAFWFVGPNGWLEGRAPVERLSEADALVEAARHESVAWMG